MQASYRFFRNEACSYFPCHPVEDKEKFNCLFCYCPLYFLGKRCGGAFSYISGVKDCSACQLPHQPENYNKIIQVITENITNNE